MKERPPTLSSDGERMNLILPMGYKSGRIPEMRDALGMKTMSDVVRHAIDQLYENLNNPSPGDYEKLGKIGLMGVVENAKDRDFSDLIREAETLILHTQNYVRFMNIHKHQSALNYRFVNGLTTKLVLPPSSSQIEELMHEQIVTYASQFQYLTDRGATMITRSKQCHLLPRLSIVTESVMVDIPYSGHGIDPSFALMWSISSEISNGRATSLLYADTVDLEDVLLKLHPKGRMRPPGYIEEDIFKTERSDNE